jgi:hypothetical protein
MNGSGAAAALDDGSWGADSPVEEGWVKRGNWAESEPMAKTPEQAPNDPLGQVGEVTIGEPQATPIISFYSQHSSPIY